MFVCCREASHCSQGHQIQEHLGEKEWHLLHSWPGTGCQICQVGTGLGGLSSLYTCMQTLMNTHTCMHAHPHADTHAHMQAHWEDYLFTGLHQFLQTFTYFWKCKAVLASNRDQVVCRELHILSVLWFAVIFYFVGWRIMRLYLFHFHLQYN